MSNCPQNNQYTVYPCGIDSSSQLPIAVDSITPVKAEFVNRQRDSIISIESELGIQPSGTYTTVRARLDALDGIIESIIVSGGGGLSTVLQNGTTILNAVSSMDFIGTGFTVTAGSVPGRVSVTVHEHSEKQETLPVSINGQTNFTLSEAPNDATTVEMFINGNKQQYGAGKEYIVTNSIVSYLGPLTLLTSDIIEFWYVVSSGISGGGGGLNTVLEDGTAIVSSVTSMNFTGGGVSVTSDPITGRVNVAIHSIGEIQETKAVTSPGQTGFILTNTPNDATAVEMFINGAKQQYGVDYTATGTTVTYSGSFILKFTDIVEFWYITGSAGGSGGGGTTQTLAQTLVLGNNTGGKNIQIDSTDSIVGQPSDGFSNGGNIVINSANGGAISGSGGNISILSGNGGPDGSGGTITLKPGTKSGVGINGSIFLQDNSGSNKLQINDIGIGAFSTSPVGQQSVTGSRASGAALASFLTAMANLGFIIDNSTA